MRWSADPGLSSRPVVGQFRCGLRWTRGFLQFCWDGLRVCRVLSRRLRRGWCICGTSRGLKGGSILS